MTLGLTDGTNFAGIAQAGGSYNRLVSRFTTYGKMVGSSSPSSDQLESNIAAGITTDPTKSGIVGTVDLTSSSIKAIIKY